MRNLYINLPTVEAVQRFIEHISPLEGNIDLLSDGYIVDARSLMSVLSLKLSKPLLLSIENDTEEAMNAIRAYISEPQGIDDMPVNNMNEIKAARIEPRI